MGMHLMHAMFTIQKYESENRISQLKRKNKSYIIKFSPKTMTITKLTYKYFV